MLQLLHRSEASDDGSVSSSCSACVFKKRGVSQSLAAHAPATMDASGVQWSEGWGGHQGRLRGSNGLLAPQQAAWAQCNCSADCALQGTPLE